MNLQSETIRINIELDDRNVVRNLQGITRELENLVRESENATTAIGRIGDSLNESEGFLHTAAGNFDAFGTAIGIMTSRNDEILDGITSWFDPLKNLSGGMGDVTEAAGTMIGAKAGMVGTLKAFLGPIGLIITALVIGVSLFSAFRSTEEAAEDLGEEAETLRERIDNLNEAIRRNREAHEGNMEAIRNHERLTGSMIDRISELNDAQEFSGESQRKLKIWVDQFNDAMGETVLTIDRQTGRLDENSQKMIEHGIFNRDIAIATREFDEKSRDLNVALEDQNRIIGDMEYADLATQIRIAEEALEYYREGLERAEETTISGERAAQRKMLLIRDATEAYEEAQAEVDRLRGYYYELNDEYENSVTLIADLERQMAESYVIMRNLVADYVDEHGIQYWMLNDTQRDVVHEMLGRWETYRDMGSEMFRKLAYDSAISLDTVLQNQAHNLQATADWQDNLALLYAKYGAEVEAHFRDMGESGMSLVAEMATDVRASYKEMEDGSFESIYGMEEASQATQIVDNLSEAGHLAGRGVVKGLDEGAEDVLAIVEDLGNRAPQSLSDRFDAAGFDQIGARVVEVTAEGLLREGPTIERTAVKTGNYVLVGWEDAFESGQERINQCARMMFLGFTQTMNEEKQEPIDIMRETARDIYEELRGFNEQNSPSRLYMRAGRFMLQGLIEGIESLRERPISRLESIARNMHRVYNSSSRDYNSIGRDIINGLNDGILNREGTVMSTARRIADNIARTMRQALDINSPSRVMREQIGRFIPEGVAAGIEKYAGVAINSVDKLADDMVRINIPSVESIIGMRPSLSMAGMGGYGNSSQDNRIVNNYDRLFEGANIHWHNKEDIRQTMEEIAWASQQDERRMW